MFFVFVCYTGYNNTVLNNTVLNNTVCQKDVAYMPGFLIQYQRRSGQVQVTKYDSLLEATQERMHLDKSNYDPGLEIVAVASRSEAHLRKSHARYFFAA